MDFPIATIRENIDEVVRRAEAGEDVVLTRDGEPVVRLSPVQRKWSTLTQEQRRTRLRDLVASFPKVPDDGVSAARSQDFLYDEFGLPK